MINVISISILMSIDLFIISMMLNIKSIYIPFKSYVTTILTSTVILTISITFSNIFTNIINNNTCSIISGILFILMGIYQVYDNNNNKKIDLNNSKTIETKEAFIMGLSASIDSIVIGISIGLSNYNIFYCIIISTLCNIIALTLGKITKFINNSYLLELFCSFLFILIGIIKIINHSN